MPNAAVGAIITAEIVTRCRHCRLQTRAQVGVPPSPMFKVDRSRYRIVPIASRSTASSGARARTCCRSPYVDALLAGADESDANVIAQAIAVRAWPSFEERLAVFRVSGLWKPSADPFTGHRPESTILSEDSCRLSAAPHRHQRARCLCGA
jgi:hypothetical protein